MRIIGGQFKGRIIHVPNTLKIRPTTDMAKESLFNIIENTFCIEKITVLDLFAGTGSISFEFVSRGAKAVTLVENNAHHFQNIRKNIDILQIKHIKPVKINVFYFLSMLKTTFDVIFADPPFTMQHISKLPELIFEKKLLKNKGWFILEHNSSYDFSSSPFLFNIREYGGVKFSFFTYR